MIRIARGPEPEALEILRRQTLNSLRALGRTPTSGDITGYRVVAEDLWRAQHHKCCYCEHRIMKGFHDVEHYRPKGSANRRPGSAETHGYWWLSFTWENLVYACPACNRSGKNDLFPLADGGVPLYAEEQAPGLETPLLLDPAGKLNPIEHIIFEQHGGQSSPSYWWARPRNGSAFGSVSIDVCDLNRQELLELRNDHFEEVIDPHIRALNRALRLADHECISWELDRAQMLLTSRGTHVAFTYDALSAHISNETLVAAGHKAWPAPDQVAT